MKIEILKSAKGNDQKQKNRPNPKTPDPQNPGRPTCHKKTRNEGKESYQKIGVQTQPNMK